MNHEQINTFIAVTETGSFNKAAKKLFVSDVAIMKQIRALEKEFSSTFFSCSQKGCALTEEGTIFLHGAIQFKKMYDDLMCSLEEYRKATDTIKLGYDPDMGLDFLIPLIKKFTEASNSMIKPIKYDYDDFFNAVLSSEIDAAFIAEPNLYCPKGLLFNKTVKSAYYAMYRKENEYFRKEAITLNDLRGINIYFTPIKYNENYEYFINKIDKKQLIPLSINEFIKTKMEGVYITTGLFEKAGSEFMLVKIKDLSSWWGLLSKTNSAKDLNCLIQSAKNLTL